MATQSGRIASVRVGVTKIAGQGTWTLGGFTREVIEEDSWDLDIKKKYFSVADAGTITFSGLYDGIDTTGQDFLQSCCLNSSSFTGGATSTATLNFYIDSTSYWTVTTGGNILITKCRSVTMEKSAMGTTDFEGVVSGAELVLI